MAMAGTAIPTIDLGRADDPAAKPGLLADLRAALTDVGFLYVAGHGVPDGVVADLVAVLPPLFALPAAAKRAVALDNSPHFLGYSGVGDEQTAGRADAREQFEFATELPAARTGGGPRSDGLVGPNQWPDLPGVRPAVEAYIAALTALGERFLRLVAEALELAPDTFLPYLSEQHRLKVVRYPPVGGGEDGEDGSSSSPDADADGLVQGVGPHKDSSGWWTFLLQASPPAVRGLQVLTRAGAWVDVPAVPGTLVVNIGQAFEVVTHGLCPATTHRVVFDGRRRSSATSTTSATAAVARFSVPFFQGVRRSLTKREALEPLRAHFAALRERQSRAAASESAEGAAIDSAFLRGRYDTWGEAQLRTKVRSHRATGRRFYADVYDEYVHDG